MYPDAGSVLDLHAFRTAHHVGRAASVQLTCGDQERVHGAHISPAPKHALTTTLTVRPEGSSLQAETGRSEQGDVRSRSRWPRLVPPPPLFHRTHGLRGRALGCSRQGEGCTIEVDSSSLTPGVGRLYQVTTPAGREEPGTSLYPSYTDPPHAPRPRERGSCQEATSGVSCTPASPGPGGSGPASLPPSPPGPGLAAGAIAGAVGARGI